LFGVPGALNYGRWQGNTWHLQDVEALCSLDSARFRLPLMAAYTRLLGRNTSGALIVQAPGLARGVAGAELLPELVRCADIDAVVVLRRSRAPPLLAHELASCDARIVYVDTGETADRLTRAQRTGQRSRLWQKYMAAAKPMTLNLSELQLLGTPPPLDVTSAWQGRQIALLHAGRLKTMGEVNWVAGDQVQVKVATEPGQVDQLLVRDALCSEGLLRTAKPHKTPPAAPTDPLVVGFFPANTSPQFAKDSTGGPVPTARVGPATATLVNGVFGDSLLKVQLNHQRRSLLFDLGDPGRMAARVAHQISDIFFTHTHADHIGGFLWFLRSRIGDLPPCRCYGPPGLARQIAGMANGILWDRVGHRAPRFEVREWHEDHMKCYRVVAGVAGEEPMADLPLAHGLLLQEASFAVRATALDHGTLVLAYAFQPTLQIKVRRDQLQARGLQAGHWLQDLQQQLSRGNLDGEITLPTGGTRSVAQLKDDLLLVTPGHKLVYATDFADTRPNRERLVKLAAGAHTLFCEAAFMMADSEQARHTQHLTTAACAEIANAAEVTHLMPFHFSKRYIKRAAEVYEELRGICERTVVPGQFTPPTTFWATDK
jgi:ribonuclease BN (tRNA processing enzyme)